MDDVSLPLPLRIALIIVGTGTFVIGIIGVFLPVVPTVPFWLVTAGCYTRASDRFYRWFINHRLVGDEFRQVLAGQGVTRRTKIVAFVLGWSMIGLSIVFVVNTIFLRLLLVGLALIQAYVLVRLKTYKPESA